jgi:hypothetical protein
MPAIEPNELQKLFIKAKKEFKPLYLELNEAIAENIGENTPAVAVDIAYRETDFLNKSQDIINKTQVASSASAFSGTQILLDLGLAKDYFLYTKFADGVNLSDTIHSGESQKAVKSVLKDAFKVNTSATKVMKDLNIATAGKTEIETGINEIIKSFKGADAKETVKSLKKLKRHIANLKEDSSLKRSYERLVKAVEGGKEEAIIKAIEKATTQQAKYINERITRTEMARAYDMSVSRAIEEEEGAIGFRWLLSSGHPRPDICDCYAEADAYGMGAGVYPADAGARIPAHPNCLCTKEVWYRNPNKSGKQVGRYSTKRVDEYLEGLSDKKRGQLIGVGNSQDKNTYQTGLNKNGYVPNKKDIRMVSKSILKRRETE